MDIFGLSALDRLFCFMIVQELQNFTKYLQRNLMKTAGFVKQLHSYVTEAGDGSDLMSRFGGGGSFLLKVKGASVFL